MRNYVIAVDLGGTNIRVALVHADGRITRRISRPSLVREGKARVIDSLLSAVEELYQENYEAPQGIGIGVAGAIDLKTGTITQSPNLPGWDDVPLQKLVKERLSFSAEVFLENDANAAALGEYWKGAGAGSTTMICLTIGTGIGGGVIVNDMVLHGADGMASELGHITVDPQGPRCNCGNTGCLEALASATAIQKSAADALRAGHRSSLKSLWNRDPDSLTAKAIADAAYDGDDPARRIYQDMGTWLGIGIATLINVFNPEKVIIGGQVSKAWELFIESMQEEISRRALRVPARRAELLPARCGDDAGLLGAAYMVFSAKETGGKELRG
jgi:glucokinase